MKLGGDVSRHNELDNWRNTHRYESVMATIWLFLTISETDPGLWDRLLCSSNGRTPAQERLGLRANGVFPICADIPCPAMLRWDCRSGFQTRPGATGKPAHVENTLISAYRPETLNGSSYDQ